MSDLLPLDPEASGEKSQVSLWWDECRASSDATAQAEEEGQQDGLDHDGLRMLSALHYNTIVFYHLGLSSSFPPLLFYPPT